jgi:hypothetical protein
MKRKEAVCRATASLGQGNSSFSFLSTTPNPIANSCYAKVNSHVARPNRVRCCTVITGSKLGNRLAARMRRGKCEYRETAAVGVQDSASGNRLITPWWCHDGGCHDATINAAWTFLCSRRCNSSLRLHLHAETDKKVTRGKLAGGSFGRTSTWLFRSRRRKGRQLDRQQRASHQRS